MTILNILITATDQQGNVSTQFQAGYDVSNKPVISNAVITPFSAVAGTLRTLTITASDVDGGQLTFQAIDATTGQAFPLTSTAQPNTFTFIG